MNLTKLLLSVFLIFLSSCVQKMEEIKSFRKSSEQGDKTIYYQMEPNCCSLNQFAESDTSPAATALRKVAQIPEIKKFAEENAQEIRYLVSEEKSRDQLCTRVQIGLEKETHFSNSFLFYVNKSSRKIQIWDAISDSIMSLKDWRKAQ